MSFKRCANGHMFNHRIHGNICPYCHLSVAKETDAGDDAGTTDELEMKLLIEEIDPVCGWLACIDGPRQGQSYVIHSGRNFIGRADDMHIRLAGDDQVARRNHASIAYDNKNRSFMLLPGESDGIIYMDGAAVYTPVLLNDMSIIQLGRTKLLFKPLCGENFAWNLEK